MSTKHKVADLALAPILAFACLPMKAARATSMRNLPLSRAIFRWAGVFPLINNYYEPLFDPINVASDRIPRKLPGIDFELDAQVELLRLFEPHHSLERLPKKDPGDNGYYLGNPNFSRADADLWFHIIRHLRPAKIIEIGSGHSTRLARLAIETLVADDPSYSAEHVCIEPYEMPWLDELGVHVIRRRVEDVEPAHFDSLQRNDILFIDSSHVIRPSGDVVSEILQIVPGLAPGVVVHFHDIFSPRDYPMVWLEYPRFWNEQYLLEAFMTCNSEWQVFLAANLLRYERPDELARICPHFEAHKEPGSFYIRRRE